MVNAPTLAKLLATYGIIPSKAQVNHILSACTRCHQEDDAEGEDNDDAVDRLVTFDDLLTSIPLWKLIAVSRE